MKIYAKQVPPEYQESPISYFGYPEDVYVYGNRQLSGNRDEEIYGLRDNLLELSDEWKYLNDGGSGYYKNWKSAINDIFPASKDGHGYTRKERLKIAEIAVDYEEYEDDDIICAALEIITGRKWENSTIRGCRQGDWQDIIYPAEYGREGLKAFETEYFNTGEEWRVDPDGDNISVYTHGWREDDVRQEIADAYGCDPADVVLLKFTGWSRSANYEEVSARKS